MLKKNDKTAKLCYKLFESSGEIGYYELYKRLSGDGHKED